MADPASRHVRVVKSLNSSVVLVTDGTGHEWLLLGKGIGYGRRAGDQLDPRDADRVFVPLSHSGSPDYLQTLSFLTPERLQVTEEIVQEAERRLECTLDRYIYVALTDHLAFVLERAKSGSPVTPALGWEVQDLYPEEYAVSVDALSTIARHTGIQLPQEEAVSITLHLVNASQLRPDMPALARLSNFLDWFTSYLDQLNPEAEPKARARLVRHARLLFQRLMNQEALTEDVGELLSDYRRRHPAVMDQVDRVERQLKLKWQAELTDEERLHLALYLKPIIKPL